MKLFSEIKGKTFDACGIDYPNNYQWYLHKGIYYPCEICLFEFFASAPDKMPTEIEFLMTKYESQFEEGLSYEQCREILKAFEKEGYTFDYGLDACPYDLKRIAKPKHFLDSEEFYNLMQYYRHASGDDQQLVSQKFQMVKNYIIDNL